MTPAALLRLLWARRLFILLSAIGCCAVAITVAALSPTYYQSSARVQLDVMGRDAVNGGAMSSEYALAYVATQAELIKDYSVTGRAADASGLLASPQMAAAYQASSARQEMDFRRWLANMLGANTTVGLVPDTNILDIRYIAETPELAAALAELIRTAYLDETLSADQSGAMETAEWFAKQRDELSERLTQAQKTMTDFERDNDVVLLTGDSTGQETRLRSWRSIVPRQSNDVVSATTFAPATKALAQIRQRISAASQSLGPNHPDMIALREQERSLEQAAAQEQAALEPGQGRSRMTQEQLRQQESRVIDQGEKADELRRLAADVQLLENQYAATARRAADAEMMASSIETGFSAFGPATVPIEPAFPQYGKVIGLSLGLGLGLGILTALLMELLSLKVRHIGDLQMVGARVLNAKTQADQQDRSDNWLKDLFRRARLIAKRRQVEGAVSLQ